MRRNANAATLIEAIAAILLGLTGWLAYSVWPELPAVVPVHFDLRGNPDAWGGRHFFWIIPALALTVFLLMLAVRRWPELMNIPFRVDRKQPEVRALLMQTAVLIQVQVMAIFLALTWGAARVALGEAQRLWMGLPVLVAIMLLSIIIQLVRLWKFRLL